MIAGYRELTQEEIYTINSIKNIAAELEGFILELESTDSIDKRWLAIAKTDLQKGFMSLTRSVAKPTTF